MLREKLDEILNEILKKKIDEILNKTNGKLIYNEQMVEILMACGYNKDDADAIRKDYGKLNIAKIRKWEQNITAKCGNELGSELVQLFRKSVNSLYPKCHTESL